MMIRSLYYVYFCIFLQYNIETTEQLYETSLAQIHTTSIIICATNCNLNILFMIQKHFLVNCIKVIYQSEIYHCQTSRYLLCRNSTKQRRQDYNLTCIFSRCQASPTECKLGSTIITFDDIPSPHPNSADLPAYYHNLTWKNRLYVNATVPTILRVRANICSRRSNLKIQLSEIDISSLIRREYLCMTFY